VVSVEGIDKTANGYIDFVLPLFPMAMKYIAEEE